MEYRDFLAYYHSVHVCYYHPGYKYSSMKMDTNIGEHDFFQLDIHNAGEYYFCLSQKDKRLFSKNSNFALSFGCLMLIRQDKLTNKFEYVGGMEESQRDIWFRPYLIPGRYYLYVKDFINIFFSFLSIGFLVT